MCRDVIVAESVKIGSSALGDLMVSFIASYTIGRLELRDFDFTRFFFFYRRVKILANSCETLGAGSRSSFSFMSKQMKFNEQ